MALLVGKPVEELGVQDLLPTISQNNGLGSEVHHLCLLLNEEPGAIIQHRHFVFARLFLLIFSLLITTLNVELSFLNAG